MKGIIEAVQSGINMNAVTGKNYKFRATRTCRILNSDGAYEVKTVNAFVNSEDEAIELLSTNRSIVKSDTYDGEYGACWASFKNDINVVNYWNNDHKITKVSKINVQPRHLE